MMSEQELMDREKAEVSALAYELSPMSSNLSMTERLQLFVDDDVTFVDSLLLEVLPKLREIAERELKREHHGAPLTKIELIHEVWLSHLSRGGWQVQNQGHFFALASLAMRRILVDLARTRLTARRGAGEPALSLDKAGPLLAGGEQQDAARVRHCASLILADAEMAIDARSDERQARKIVIGVPNIAVGHGRERPSSHW
jgi:hypothetical protein